MDWLLFFVVIVKAVLFSTGGFGPLPSLHTDFIANGWATEKQFTEALAIGQVTPGPNGLWVVSLAYLVAGVPGAVLAAIALLLPPLLILIVQRCYTRIAGKSATEGFLDGVVLVIVSFNIVVLTDLFFHNQVGTLMIAVALISLYLAITRKVSANLILLVAAVIGGMTG
ncbi:MAG: chromate transporter [Sporomusaceae bacterium]|nr:chromate transporter [Sporomusaceae bacterium]